MQEKAWLLLQKRVVDALDVGQKRPPLHKQSTDGVWQLWGHSNGGGLGGALQGKWRYQESGCVIFAYLNFRLINDLLFGRLSASLEPFFYIQEGLKQAHANLACVCYAPIQVAGGDVHQGLQDRIVVDQSSVAAGQTCTYLDAIVHDVKQSASREAGPLLPGPGGPLLVQLQLGLMLPQHAFHLTHKLR
ncbi:MAG: hypothetical protein FRX49_02535 [Trebouxia sp. A1-2]|nr:MAG: hypothetical protein FRX49_13051 [Trebouxia sp. A1-2]KAA6427873.1 MAG: hypothetical protein FRX49_02535 [Trebouxia sp. A1-2]